jgi:hypothetical protein
LNSDEPSLRAVPPAFPDQQQKDDGGKKAVGEVGILRPLGPKPHAKANREGQEDRNQTADTRG